MQREKEENWLERKGKKRKGEVTMNFGETDLKAQHNVADADGDSKEIK